MELLELIKKLVSFKSYIGNKKEIDSCLNFCLDYLKNNSKIFIKEVEKNGIKSILFSNVDDMDLDVLEVAHIDVVPVNDFNMFNVKVENDIMYGRGTADMKSFVACGMHLLEYVIRKSLKLKYGLLIVSDEETGGFDGAQYWAEELNLKTKILLDADAGNNLNKIINKTKACLMVKLISKGETAHGSQPWSGIDANENIIKTINNIRKIFPYISKKNIPENKWVTTMHVGVIKGGEADNCISEYAEALLDFRYTEKYNDEKILNIIEECLEDGVNFEIQEKGILVFNDLNNNFLQLYKKIVEDITKNAVNFDFSTGASDARYFAKSNTVIISNQADCGDLHGDNEWLNIEKLRTFLEIRKKFIDELNNIF